jgi:hypothetical protein
MCSAAEKVGEELEGTVGGSDALAGGACAREMPHMSGTADCRCVVPDVLAVYNIMDICRVSRFKLSI